MADILDLLSKCSGFEWDAGNKSKNWINHEVEMREAEQALRNFPIALSDDYKHSFSEPRYIALGRTDANRLLSIAFTIRGDKVRVISARDMSQKERKEYYAEGTQKST